MIVVRPYGSSSIPLLTYLHTYEHTCNATDSRDQALRRGSSGLIYHAELAALLLFWMLLCSNLGYGGALGVCQVHTEQAEVDDVSNQMFQVQVGSSGGMRGELYKLGGKRKNKWQRRYFVVDEVGINWYRVSDGKPELKGNLYGSTIISVKSTPDPTGNGKFVLTVITQTKDNKQYVLAADQEVDRAKWIGKIRELAAAQ